MAGPGRPPSGKQEVFLDAYSRTADALYAAEKAGYGSPAATAGTMLKRPQIREAIASRRAARDDLADALPAVVAEHKRRLLDKKTTNREFSGLVAPFYKAAGISHDEGGVKEPHEMTPDELAKAINALEAQAAALARPVEAVAEASVFD